MLKEKEYIYEIYKEKSFPAAARKLYVSQPALAASVKKAEEELGGRIFDRRGQKTELTEIGRAVIETIEKINAAEQELSNRISDINELRTGTLTVGAPNSVFTCVLPDILERYRSVYPGIELRFLEASSEELKEAAAAGLTDVCLDYDFDGKIFCSVPLVEEKIYLCAAAGSDFARKYVKYALGADDVIKSKRGGTGKKVPAIDLSACRDSMLILLKKGNDMCSRAERMLAEAGLYEYRSMRLDQLMSSYTLSCRGLGISFVTDTVICSSGRKAAYFRIDSQYSSRTLCLARSRHTAETGRLKKFTEIAKQICSSI